MGGEGWVGGEGWGDSNKSNLRGLQMKLITPTDDKYPLYIYSKTITHTQGVTRKKAPGEREGV